MLRQQRRSSPRAAALGACSVLLAALLLCAQRAAAAADLYSEDGDVHLIEGGKDAFKEAILSSHGAAVVRTRPCGRCRCSAVFVLNGTRTSAPGGCGERRHPPP